MTWVREGSNRLPEHADLDMATRVVPFVHTTLTIQEYKLPYCHSPRSLAPCGTLRNRRTWQPRGCIKCGKAVGDLQLRQSTIIITSQHLRDLQAGGRLRYSVACPRNLIPGTPSSTYSLFMRSGLAFVLVSIDWTSCSTSARAARRLSD